MCLFSSAGSSQTSNNLLNIEDPMSCKKSLSKLQDERRNAEKRNLEFRGKHVVLENETLMAFLESAEEGASMQHRKGPWTLKSRDARDWVCNSTCLCRLKML